MKDWIELIAKCLDYLIKFWKWIFSVGTMSILCGVALVIYFFPSSILKKIGLLKFNNHILSWSEEILWVAIGSGFLAVLLLVMEKYAAHKENCAFDQMMGLLSKEELQALCNTYFNNGKWSLYSSSVVLTSLKQKQLILASETEGNFGSIEFALTDRARDYLTKHPDFFSNQKISPEQEDVERHFPYAII